MSDKLVSEIVGDIHGALEKLGKDITPSDLAFILSSFLEALLEVTATINPPDEETEATLERVEEFISNITEQINNIGGT